MDIIIEIIGLCFIPLLGAQVFGGMRKIYQGLKEFYQFKGLKSCLNFGPTRPPCFSTRQILQIHN